MHVFINGVGRLRWVRNPWLPKDICKSPKLTIVPCGKEMQCSQNCNNGCREKFVLLPQLVQHAKGLQIFATTS